MPGHLDALTMATSRLHSYAESAGLDAPVPTCSGWQVRNLIAHTGMVHRWGTAIVRGDSRLDTELTEEQGLATSDPLDWLGRGSDELVATLRRAPADLDVFFFLQDAPPPREAWARRMCHETTIHAVDALTAHAASWTRAEDANIAPALAADGIDELLCGFATRRRENLRTHEPLEVDVRATDTGDVWRARVSADPLRVTRGTQARDADAVLSGTAAELYLGLWNRGRDVHCQGIDVLSLWRERMQIGWG